MSDEESADKPHDPTPARLEEARKKGEIVRSADLNTAVAYTGFFLALKLFAPFVADRLGGVTQTLFARADQLAPAMLSPGGLALAGGVMMRAGSALALILILPAAMVLAALIAQRGILFTPSRLQPKLSRISILSNARNKFGANGLFEFAKAGTKLLIYGVLLLALLWARTDQILTTIYGAPGQILAELGRLGLEFLGAVVLVSVVMAAADFLWQWQAHLRKHRLSHQELVDETRRSEGDPHQKQERRQRGIEIAMNRMLADVPTADVVVVNPTHFAVALKWERGLGNVPVCVAKGTDEIARKIRETAAEAGVPIYHDAPTARTLHAALDIGEAIEPDHFRAVAAAIRFADRMRAAARRARR